MKKKNKIWQPIEIFNMTANDNQIFIQVKFPLWLPYTLCNALEKPNLNRSYGNIDAEHSSSIHHVIGCDSLSLSLFHSPADEYLWSHIDRTHNSLTFQANWVSQVKRECWLFDIVRIYIVIYIDIYIAIIWFDVFSSNVEHCALLVDWMTSFFKQIENVVLALNNSQMHCNAAFPTSIFIFHSHLHYFYRTFYLVYWFSVQFRLPNSMTMPDH